MQKITVKVEDDLYEKVNARSIKKGCKTLSQCGRELFDLALKVEEAASLQSDENSMDEIHPLLLDVLKTNMTWSLETMFLVRLLVGEKADTDSVKMSALMKQAKEKAVNYVADFMEKITKSLVRSN